MEQRKTMTPAERYPTPFYLLDLGVLEERIQELRTLLPKQTGLCFATKANPFLVRSLKAAIDRYEVCSEGELQICMEQKISAEKIVFSGVYKQPEILAKLVRQELPFAAITVESMRQFCAIEKAAENRSQPVSLLLRLTSGNQFGLNEEEIEDIVLRCDGSRKICLKGLQYYSGTQKTSLKKIRKELDRLDNFLQCLTASTGIWLSELEYGPGLPIHYFQGEDTQSEKTYFSELSTLLQGMSYPLKITIETGRSLAAGCGSYWTRVVDTKTNGGENYAIVDGGVHQLVYYGQMMATRRPFCKVLPPREEGDEQHWNICGSLCTANDILLKEFPTHALQPGDVFVFENAGAYCMTEGMSLFLSHDLPCVILKDSAGEYRCVRAPFPTAALNNTDY